MRRFLVGFLATIGALSLISLVLAGYFGWRLVSSFEPSEPLPESMVLSLDLRGSIPAVRETRSFMLPGFGAPLEASAIVRAIDHAASDPDVTGLTALVGDSAHGLGVAQEIADAIARFRATGKPAHAWADTFGELNPANEAYLIAAAFSTISLQPGGLVGLSGIAIETPFVRGLLDSIGIEFETVKREEFKTALDIATETGLTDANRLQLESLASDIVDQLTAAIAAGRGVEPAQARRLQLGGPYDAETALSLGLVDAIAWRDEVIATLDDAGSETMPVRVADYFNARVQESEPDGDRPVVALVEVGGTIVRGDDELSSNIMGGTLARLIERLRDDDSFDGLILRVDSPGGSATASETIGRALRRYKETGRPLVVSMVNTAASGGYWISMDADRIVAQPGTLTGSIGVIAGKPVLASLWERLGVNWETIAIGERAGMWSINREFTADERAWIERSVDQLYERFKEGVAEGRQMSPAAVQAVAQGRVWTGRQALELGLVDQLGGIDTAAREMAELLGLDEGQAINLVPYPEPETEFDLLKRLARGDFEVGDATTFLATLTEWLGLSIPPAGPATAPTITIR